MEVNPQTKMTTGLMTDMEITIQKIGMPISCFDELSTTCSFWIPITTIDKAKFVLFNFETTSYF